MTMTFREALEYWMDKTGTSLPTVAEKAGVSFDQLAKVKQGKTKRTNFDDGVKVARVFCASLDDFLAGKEGKAQDSLVRSLESLSPEARAVLENAVNAQLAAEKED